MHVVAKRINPDRLHGILARAQELLAEMRDMMSKKEVEFIERSLKTKAIPKPKLLVKDHKEKKASGDYPTRLIVPANNFTSGYSKMGYMAIKNTFDEMEIKYSRFTIGQASDLKGDLEKLNIKRSEVTIVSADAVKMYPSITYSMIEKAIEYFSTNLDQEARNTVKAGMQMIKFGMGATIVQFRNEYWEYGGDAAVKDKGLTIGGFESAWIADVVMAWIMEEAGDLFEEAIYKGIYRDDGIVLFKGNKKKRDVIRWLGRFQKRVNELTNSNRLQFTAEVWGQDKRDRSISKTVKVDCGKYFAYLDTKMSWNQDDELQFGVYMKENQNLKYLNKGSIHRKSCFDAIPQGVMGRLAKLTTRTSENENKTLKVLYPNHAAALEVAGIAPETYPKLGEKLDELKKKAKEKAKKKSKEESEELQKKRKGDYRTIFCCIGTSQVWKYTPIHTIIKKLRDKHGLKWLRCSMSHHRFSNLREIFQGDLEKKMMKGIESQNFRNEKCNCNARSKINGQCAFDGNCRQRCVVYKATCRICKKFYIGNTQQFHKARMRQHANEVGRCVHLNEGSDTHAKHFASHVGTQKVTQGLIRTMVKHEIIWQGNPIACSKSFGGLRCSLCMRERQEIYKANKHEKDKLMNSGTEIYGACRHNPTFHRYSLNRCQDYETTSNTY